MPGDAALTEVGDGIFPEGGIQVLSRVPIGQTETPGDLSVRARPASLRREQAWFQGLVAFFLGVAESHSPSTSLPVFIRWRLELSL